MLHGTEDSLRHLSIHYFRQGAGLSALRHLFVCWPVTVVVILEKNKSDFHETQHRCSASALNVTVNVSEVKVNGKGHVSCSTHPPRR